MIKFLEKSVLLTFHEDHLRSYGGLTGIRDHGLLDSALAQPVATFDGEYIHKDIFQMAAAYGYHICRNHPFVDGNKRTALVAMYLFLYVNGHQLIADKKSMYAIVMEVADGSIEKQQLADFLASNTQAI